MRLCFFFSSRRRHTRFDCDWSSDVCSSDLGRVAGLLAGQGDVINNVPVEELSRFENHPRVRAEKVEGVRMYFLAMNVTRSEERRVGKECRSRRAPSE